MNWKQFTTQDFWFDIDRIQLHRIDHLILYFGLALVVLGIIMLIYRRFAKNEFLQIVAGKIATVFLTIGILEMIWFLLRAQYVNALGTKFAAAIVALAGLIWLYSPIKYLFTRYDEDMQEAQRKIQREKYLKR